MIKTKYFSIQELVDKETYDKYGEFAWHFLDKDLLLVIDYLRETFGSALVNTYMWNSTGFQHRGLRSPYSSVGSPYSQHKFGRGLDISFKNISAQEVRDWLRQWWTEELSLELFGKIVCITVEEDVSWLHIDVRNNDKVFNSFEP